MSDSIKKHVFIIEKRVSYSEICYKKEVEIYLFECFKHQQTKISIISISYISFFLPVSQPRTTKDDSVLSQSNQGIQIINHSMYRDIELVLAPLMQTN